MNQFEQLKTKRQRACADRVIELLAELTLDQGMSDEKADTEALVIITMVFSQMAAHLSPEGAAGALGTLYRHSKTLIPLLRQEIAAGEIARAMQPPRTMRHMDGAMTRETSVGVLFDGIEIQTPRGVVAVHDMPGITSMKLDHRDIPATIALMVYQPAAAGVGVGYAVQVDPEGAKLLGQSLIKLAEIVQGQG